ncbi:hypothetical protein K1I58_12150, partial [Streptococcus sanguinis]|nr:hypothetical protein [Streptococcus sanguinis]
NLLYFFTAIPTWFWLFYLHSSGSASTVPTSLWYWLRNMSFNSHTPLAPPSSNLLPEVTLFWSIR